MREPAASEPTILRVDRGGEDRHAIARLLHAQGATVLHARTGAAARALLAERDVAVVLLGEPPADLELPSLMALLSRGEPAPEVPVVLAGGAPAEPAVVARAYQLGVVDVLPDPVDPTVLAAKLRTLLRLHRQTQELAVIRRRLEALMEAAPVGISFSTDPSCREVTGNATTLAQFEAGPGDNLSASAPEPAAAGRRVRYRIGGEEVPDSALPLQRAAAENRVVGPVELEITLPSGRVWYAQAAGAPVRDAAGRVVGGIAVTVDVTARAAAERAARASEQRFRALADSMPQLVWTAWDDGVVGYYNARVAEYAGATQDEAGRWAWQPMLHPDDLARTTEAWREAVAREALYACEHRMRMADGRYRWHLSRARPVRSEATGALTWYGTATDIHDRKAVELELGRTSAVLSAINQATPVLIAVKDRTGRYVYANPACLEVLGRPASEVHGHDDLAWFDAATGGAIMANDRRVMAERTTASFEEHTPDGRAWLSSKTPWLDADGAVLGVIVVALDITERQRVQRERRENEARLAAALEVAEKAVLAREQLVSMVSHDLRNPLGAIVMQVALLRRHLDDDGRVAPETLAVGLARLERQSGKMDRLLAELLDLARLHAGRSLALERSTCDLVRLVRAVADEHRRGAPRHELVVATELPALHGAWDVDRLERVVGNLVSNAIKYSPGGGRVTLRIERDAGAALLAVEDHGVGIPAEDQARIFEWFVRGANTERHIRGTGVGLAGARQIVEQHGGTILVESEEGRGSRFIVRLPLEPADATGAGEPEPGARG